MSEWNDDMNTAPRDGTVIRVMVGRREFNVAWSPGYGWVAEYDEDYPKSWTDGVCWASNEDERPSAYPKKWRLPQPPLTGEG